MNESATAKPTRLVYLVSHPIQYQAPLLRRIAAETGIELTVLFETLVTAGTFQDAGFGRDVAWDVPLTEGYAHHAVASKADVERHLAAADVLWLHGWDSRLRRGALTLAAALGVPTLMRGENTAAAMPDGAGLRGLVKRHYLRTIFRHCAGFLCIGSDNRRYYAERGVAAERLFDMPYAVDNAFFAERAEAARPNRDNLRAELGLAPDAPVVLYAGKLQRRKHPLALYDAWRRIDGVRPALVYVGDGEERPALEARVEADGTDAQVRVLGFRNQSELPAFYDLADVFVLVSEREPWGLAINEAMACGTAAIASDQCGVAADLVDESCGAVVSAGDTAELASALARLVSDRAGLAAKGEAARRRVATWDFEADVAGLKQAIAAVSRERRKA
jgi:glycosyltransferase involved in cell wall biosynthesis